MAPQNKWSDSELSALFDDELTAERVQGVCNQLEQDAGLLDRWCDYQAVRSHLSGIERGGSTQFLQNFRLRLQQAQLEQPVVVQLKRDAANDAVFQWKLVAGLASCAAVAALAWSVFGQFSAPEAPLLAQSNMRGFASPQMIQSVPGFAAVATNRQSAVANDLSVSAQASPPVMLRDPELDELLRSHGSHAGSLSMENTAGFIRNATYGGDGL